MYLCAITILDSPAAILNPTLIPRVILSAAPCMFLAPGDHCWLTRHRDMSQYDTKPRQRVGGSPLPMCISSPWSRLYQTHVYLSAYGSLSVGKLFGGLHVKRTATKARCHGSWAQGSVCSQEDVMRRRKRRRKRRKKGEEGREKGMKGGKKEGRKRRGERKGEKERKRSRGQAL